ncbi:MAG: gamma subclass chorismate mutase AroQ, partial [Gammaproteobacteria bacterium]
MRLALISLVLLLLAAPAAAAPADELYALVGERLSLMRHVAAFKWLNDRPVEDLAREQVVIEAALSEALNRGLEPTGAEVFFQVQIEAAKDIQRYWFERWQAGSGPKTAPDLEAEVRPQLLLLGDRIIAGLGRPLAHEAATFRGLVVTEGLGEARIDALYEAIRKVVRFDSRFAQIRATGILRVGTTGDYAPFSYEVDAQGGAASWAETLRGVDVDLAEDLAEALDADLVFVRTSWPTLSADLLAGRFDVAMGGVSRTLERARIGHLSVPYYVGGKMPIARCEDRRRFGSLADIDQPGVRVIVNPGGTNERFVDERLAQ